ncbi:MAG: T9SS type A sorting domain-containing protein, partial [Lewinella sp.]
RNDTEKFQVSGYVYSDRNNNYEVDALEGIARRTVQLAVGKTVYTTQTDAFGRYTFLLPRGNAVYYLATDSGTSADVLQGSVRIYDTHRDYDGPDFRYPGKYGRPFGKQAGTDKAVSPGASDEVEITAFPNPATNFLTVTGTNLLERVQLLNLTGQRVVDLRPLTASVRLPVGRLPAGTYLLQVHTAGTRQTRKILLQ